MRSRLSRVDLLMVIPSAANVPRILRRLLPCWAACFGLIKSPCFLLELHVHNRVGVKFGFKAAAQGSEVGVNVGIALDAPAGGLGQGFDGEVFAALGGAYRRGRRGDRGVTGLNRGRRRGDEFGIPLIHLVQQADAHGISLIGIAAQGGNIIALFRFVFQLVKLRGVGVAVLRLVGLFVQHFQHAGAVRCNCGKHRLASSTST